MKIVFEFYGKPQISLGGRPYDCSGAKPLEWQGARVEGVIVDVDAPLKASESDCLYIEGDLESLKLLAAELTSQLETLEECFREQISEQIARQKQCEICKMYFDSRYVDIGHGDGKGNKCFGELK